MKSPRRALATIGVLLTTAALSLGLTTEPGNAFAGARWFEPDIAWSDNYHDPTVITVGNTYYALSGMHGGAYLPALSSTNLTTWTTRSAYSPNPYSSDPFLNDALPEGPSFGPVVNQGHPHLNQELWAPGLGQIGNKFYAYYSVRTVAGFPGRFCLSVAEATAPMGPYVDKANGTPLWCDSDPVGSIDPDPFIDSDGTPYLIWKSEGVPGSEPTKIWIKELAPSGIAFADSSDPVQLLQTELPWEGNVIENPSMVRYQGKYLLFHSANEWKSADYATGYAICDTPLGPCTRGSSSPLLASSGNELGPGGADAFIDAQGNLRIMYHYWNAPFTNYPNWPACDTDNDGQCTEYGQRRMKVVQAWLDASGKVTLTAPPTPPPSVPVVGSVIATGDFNGDGRDDTAIGAPGEDVGNLTDAGSINVIYGSTSGLSSSGDRVFTQNGAIAGATEADDHFGASVASGDFNNDGYDDVVVGAPGEDIGGKKNAGAVHVIYGSSNGLTTAGNRVYNHTSVSGAVETGDQFGFSVTTGDFNGDNYDDLAVGSPTENIGSTADAGVVNIIYGSASGLTTAGNKAFLQTTAKVGANEKNDLFGSTLTSGDFNGDTFDDLAVGAPGEDIGAINGAGATAVIYGSANGLKTSGNKLYSQSGAVASAPEAGDAFGAALASGDLNNDGHDDLVIGAPGENGGPLVDSGMIHVLLGSANGITTAGNKGYSQDGPIAGAAEHGDKFGAALAVGYMNNDSYADVVVGAPGEDYGSLVDAGVAHLILGSSSGLTTTGNKSLSSAGAYAGAEETGDAFGAAVAVGNFNGDSYDDMLFGNPGEDVGTKSNAGAVVLIRGASSGATTSGGQLLVQGFGGIAGASEAGDAFG